MLFVSLITTLDLVETVYSGDCLLSTELSDAYRLVGREKIHFTEKLFSMSLKRDFVTLIHSDHLKLKTSGGWFFVFCFLICGSCCCSSSSSSGTGSATPGHRERGFSLP